MRNVQENTEVGHQAVVKDVSGTCFIQLAIYTSDFIEWQAIFTCFDCPVLQKCCKHGTYGKDIETYLYKDLTRIPDLYVMRYVWLSVFKYVT